MGKYQVHASDANEALIVARLEHGGASVAKIGRPLDLVVGFAGIDAICEVKTLKGKERPAQTVFMNTWKGLVRVLRTEADADDLLAYMADIRRRCSRPVEE